MKLIDENYISIRLLKIRKHPIKYTLYFHKIENSISTLVKS